MESKQPNVDEQFAAFQRALQAHKETVNHETKEVPEPTPSVSKMTSAVPLSSLEEVAKKKAENDAKDLKPVFLTKKQREELALKRLEEQRAAERAESNAAQQVQMDRSVRERERKEREEQERLERQVRLGSC